MFSKTRGKSRLRKIQSSIKIMVFNIRVWVEVYNRVTHSMLKCNHSQPRPLAESSAKHNLTVQSHFNTIDSLECFESVDKVAGTADSGFITTS